MSDFEKLRREATPGSWIHIPETTKVYPDMPSIVWTSKGPGYGAIARMRRSTLAQDAKDAAFIASIHAIDDARIAAEARVAKLEKQLAEAMRALEQISDNDPCSYFGIMCDDALAKIKEIGK